MKKNWYRNIYPLQFISRGQYSDPLIKGYGKVVNYWDFEDMLYSIFCEEDKNRENLDNRTLDNEFDKWITKDKDYIKSLFKDAFIFNKDYPSYTNY